MNIAAAYPPLNVPAAPMFNSVPGYEGIVAGGGGYLPPPMPVEPLVPPQPGPVPDNWSIPSLSEEAAREAFKNYASSQCCYSESPAEEGIITNMESYNTYRYRLETFAESRSTEWAKKPYEGEPADFYTQPAPRPWEVQATPPKLFTDYKQEIRVPFTSSIQDCETCQGKGQMPCSDCHGNGYKTCRVCHGSGMSDDQSCTCCDGTGKDKCSDCNARGTEKCKTCEGKRQLLKFILLKVEWTNHAEDHVVEQNSGLNVTDLHSVSGKELFKNNHYSLYPLLGFPNQAIAEASDRLIKEHQSKYSQNSRILQQRQMVELIPITKVNYKWKGESYLYYVYGNEHQVSAEDYPETCCCVIQ
ncbi:protein SSUH2 homolog [Xiphias gladius]|uniref:protein SSUH2 homolog n=1 Tax=Xiphias gladius TaxID=8245 RepID=UPI001A984110|nr:protein SSUH2 homolog [Xiphias gladius]